ncbi:hypothetical protein [Chroococcidiopsis sp. SAG 2025]|uniref:hypothetical protein n=1 Tax=Chroococcidiopsis sp. SAG 2025 TaxID=171389 RepID=UPI0029373BDC|nr:hypothetical protein [Chroococcidiopsis sp. SAG 2025]
MEQRKSKNTSTLWQKMYCHALLLLIEVKAAKAILAPDGNNCSRALEAGVDQ